MKKVSKSKRKPKSAGSEFRQKILRFRKTLRGNSRALLDKLITGALGGDDPPALAGETKWTHEDGETLLRDIGQLMIQMDGKYRTCGGGVCRPFATDAAGDIYCVATCGVAIPGDTVASGCSCHLYSYPTPAPGQPRPKMQDWQHDWKPGNPHFTPAAGRTYECVCVK